MKLSPENNYVCGFAFDSTFTRVALIRKNRGPYHNVGKLNGIGGRIEIGEGPRGCMSREFGEECGVLTEPTDWTTFHSERFSRPEGTTNVFFMVTTLVAEAFDRARSVTDEKVEHKWLGEISWHSKDCASNLCYLMPMAVWFLRNPTLRPISG